MLGSPEYVGKAGEYEGTVRWADGATSPGQLLHLGKRCTITATHTYTKPGDRLVTVDVLAPDGGTTTLARRLHVLAGPGTTGVGPGTPPPSGKENVQPSGTVLIKVNGKFVPLTNFKQVPFGTELDTTKGAVKLTSHDGSTGSFYQGRFKLLPGLEHPRRARIEARDRNPPDRRELQGLFAHHGRRRREAQAQGQDGCATPGNAKGSFRTKGRYAAATVRGTLGGRTITATARSSRSGASKLDVFDQVKRKHFLVPGRHELLAPSPALVVFSRRLAPFRTLSAVISAR